MFHSNNGQIDLFDTEYFESILPKNKRTNKPLWTKTADKGEFVYLVEFGFGQDAFILIRSSIDNYTDMSRTTGKDSIRSYVVDKELKPILGKNKRWTTRVKNWENRLWNDLSELRKQFTKVYNQGIKCPDCGKLLRIQTNKQKETFIKCWDCEPGFNSWKTYKKISLDNL